MQSKLHSTDVKCGAPAPRKRPALSPRNIVAPLLKRQRELGGSRSVYRGALHAGTSECAPSSSAANSDWSMLTRGIGRESAAFKSCRNNSISDGVSIRGVFEVVSFRPGKAIVVVAEAEAECLSPPLFEVLSMLLS